MALTRTQLIASTSAEGIDALYTSANFTPANNSIIVVIGSALMTGDTGLEGTTLTLANSQSLTMTPIIATNDSPAWSYGAAAWVIAIGTGVSMNVTLGPGTGFHVARLEVYQYTGHDTVTPIGATARGSDADGNGAASITLSANPATTSEVVAFATKIVNSGVPGSVTVGTGWTEINEPTPITDFGGWQTQVRSGSTSTSVGWDDLDVGGNPEGATLLAFEVKAASGGSSTTVAPAQATLTLNGKTPSTSAFQNVRIRQVLVNEGGQAVANAANITLLVWYSGRFGGAPDVSLNGMTSDANGTISWSIPTGTLGYQQPIAYVAQDSVSFSNYTCARLTPSYE